MRKPAGAIALLGALLVLTSDFAGWYSRRTSLGASVSPPRTATNAQNLSFSYSSTEASDAINIWGQYVPLLLIVIALLGITAYLTLRTPPPSVTLPMGAPLWWIPAAAAVATLAFGAFFVVAMFANDPDDWWLDVGFFAGAIGGAIPAFLLRRDATAARAT